MTSDDDGQDGISDADPGPTVIDMAGRARGNGRVPQSVALALPPHLAFLIHRDSDREDRDFATHLNAMVIEYLEAYYEDDLVALDDEQLKLFTLGHLDVATGSKSD